MQLLSLNGSWQLRRADASTPPVECHVPGLLAEGLHSENPPVRIAETAWLLSRIFSVSPSFLKDDFVDLECTSIDTRSIIEINGVPVLRTDNAYRPYRSDVRSLLRPGQNEICIRFLPVQNRPPSIRPYAPPHAATIGVPGDIRLRAWSEARITEIGFSQQHPASGPIHLFIGGWIESAETDDSQSPEPLVLLFRIRDPKGIPIAELPACFPEPHSGQFHADVPIPHPQRWWLSGLGAQPLYTVEAILRKTSGGILDTAIHSVGLRTLTCSPAANGHAAQVLCNGIPVFLKGTVWAGLPLSTPAAKRNAVIDRLVDEARIAHFNVFRLAEDAPLPPDHFWKRCDEAGILVLGTRSLGDAATQSPSAFEKAASPTESEVGDDEYVPDFLSRTCVPDTVLTEPDEESGLRICRSIVSLPAPETLATDFPNGIPHLNAASLEERFTLRGGAPALFASLLAQYPLPDSQENWLTLSQIAQADELYRRIAAARLDPSRPSGLLWEPYISLWPAADQASIDANGTPKALQYEARRSFAANAIFARFDATSGTQAVFAHESPLPLCDAKLVWRLTGLEGATIAQDTIPLRRIDPFENTRLPLPDFTPFLVHYRPENLVLWLSVLSPSTHILARRHLLFVPPKDLILQNPQFSVEIESLPDTGGTPSLRSKITISTTAPAFAVRLSHPGYAFSDAFFALEPDTLCTIIAEPLKRQRRPLSLTHLKIDSFFTL